jgi:glutamate dehydrogenase
MRALWTQIEALDTRVAAKLQYSMAFQTSRLVRHVTYWLLAHRRKGLQVDSAVAEFRKGVRQLEAEVRHILTGSDRERFETIRGQHLEGGVPAELATRIASLSALNAALDIIEIATAHSVAVGLAARVYFELSARMGLDWLREQIEQLRVEGTWQAIARTGLRDGAMRAHRKLAERVLSRDDTGGADARVAAWLDTRGAELLHWQNTLADMRAGGPGDFASLSVGVESVRKLAD